MKPEMFTPLDEVLESCRQRMIEDFNSKLLNEEQNVFGLLTVLDNYKFEDSMSEYGIPVFEAAVEQLMYHMACEILGVTSMIISNTPNNVTSGPGSEISDPTFATTKEGIEEPKPENVSNRNNATEGITHSHIISCN